MKIRDKNIWTVYAAIFLVGIAYGVYVSLLAIHLDARGFSKQAIGSFAAWFAGGIIAFSIPVGAVLRRVPAKWTLGVSLLGYAACAATFPYLTSYAAIAAARFLDGAFSVGVWVSCETILLVRARLGQKALVTSLYATAIAIGYVIGPLGAKVVVAMSSIPRAFVTASALAVVAALVAWAGLDRDPAAHGHPNVREPSGLDENVRESSHSSGPPSSRLLARIKTSCFATFAYGYFQASVVLFLPLFLVESKGVAPERTIVVPAFFAAGMLLFSNVAGRLGDRFGHLRMMRFLAAVGLVMICGFVALESFAIMCGAVFVAGATLASISPVSLALIGVCLESRLGADEGTPREDMARSNAIYNFFYAAGMLLGPPLSSVVYAAAGGAAMLLHLASIWAAFVVFCVVFATDDPAHRQRRALA